ERLPNSWSGTQAGALGLSYVWDHGYVGAAPSWYHSDYGTVAEPFSSIHLEQKRLDVAGGLYDLLPRITSVKYKLGLSDYQHTEFDGDVPGTVFKNRGWDGRVGALHEQIRAVPGAVGFGTGGVCVSTL